MSQFNITDISNDFSPNPITGDISIKKNVDAVKQSLRNLLLLEEFDKPFNPKIDVGLKEILFENFPTPILQDIISRKIDYIISTYETRVELVKIDVQEIYDKNILQIGITFTLKNENQKTPQNLQINVERIR